MTGKLPTKFPAMRTALVVLAVCSTITVTAYLALPRLALAYALPKTLRVLPDLERPAANSSPTSVSETLYNIASGTSYTQITSFPQPSTTIATTEYSAIQTSSLGTINEVLDTTASLDFGDGVSLREFASTLEDCLGIPVRLDERVLSSELGLDLHEPEAIRGTFTNHRARASLNQLLSNVFETPLTFLVRHDVLLITDKQYATDNYLQTRIYPLPFDDDPRLVAELIQSVVDPNSWNTVGGPGSVMPSNDTSTSCGLIISQTESTHYDIEQLLRGREIAQGIQHGTQTTRIYTILNSNVRKQLEGSLKKICNTTLGSLADESATVSSEHEKLVIQSSSRPFIVYAHQAIRAYLGVSHQNDCSQRLPAGTTNGMGGKMGPNGGMGGGVF